MAALRCMIAVLGLVFVASGCFSSGAVEIPPDQQFGHRYEGPGPEGRPTVTLTDPSPDRAFFHYRASIDTVHVRPAPYTFDEGQSPRTRVEVLVKGSFPDGCMEMDGVEQRRAGHIITLEVTVRRPQGDVCARFVRPYRYYVMLDGTFQPGDYTLKVNAYNYTFTLRPPGEH